MPRLEPVDHDPFDSPPTKPIYQIPVDHDPFNYGSFSDRYHKFVQALPPGIMKGGAALGGMAWDLGNAIIGEPVRAFQRGLERQGQVSRGEISSGTAARLSAGDTLTTAMTPMAGNVGARAVGAMPDNALGIFAGKMAKTADMKALAQAQEMAGNGAARDEIWKTTGWFQGADGKWRFEIDDSQAKFRNIGPENSTLGKELTHPDLYAAYPDLATDVSLARVPGRGGSYARDDIFGRQIEIGKDNISRRSVALHEGQHAGQDIEGFAQGGSPAMFAYRNPQAADEAYHRLAGEVEARNVQKRRDYTADQRRNTPPWLTQDVPDQQQIVRFAAGQERQLSKDPSISEGAIGAGPMRPVAFDAIKDKLVPKSDLDSVTHIGEVNSNIGLAAGKNAEGPFVYAYDKNSGRLVGEGYFSINRNGVAKVDNVAVLPRARRQGIGTTIYQSGRQLVGDLGAVSRGSGGHYPRGIAEWSTGTAQPLRPLGAIPERAIGAGPTKENLIDIVKKYGIAGAATTLGMNQSDLVKAMNDSGGIKIEPIDYDPFSQ